MTLFKTILVCHKCDLVCHIIDLFLECSMRLGYATNVAWFAQFQEYSFRHSIPQLKLGLQQPCGVLEFSKTLDWYNCSLVCQNSDMFLNRHGIPSLISQSLWKGVFPRFYCSALQIILDLGIPEKELAKTHSQISFIYFQSHS